jgi:hypothetical protein
MYETFNGPIARAEDFQNVEGLPDTLHGPYQKLLRGAAKSRLNPKVRTRDTENTKTQRHRQREREKERKTERERQREKDRERDRERKIDRETERENERIH